MLPRERFYIMAKVEKFERDLWQDIEKCVREAYDNYLKADDLADGETLEGNLQECRQLFEATKDSRYILYNIYNVLKTKYPDDVTSPAKELPVLIAAGLIKRSEIEALKAKIKSLLAQEALPKSYIIKGLFQDMLLKHGNFETRERILQQMRQERLEAERETAADAQRAVAAEQQATADKQRILALQQQLFELRKQQAKAKDIKEESSPQSVEPTSQGDSFDDSPEGVSKKRKPGDKPSQPHIKLSRQ